MRSPGSRFSWRLLAAVVLVGLFVAAWVVSLIVDSEPEAASPEHRDPSSSSPSAGPESADPPASGDGLEVWAVPNTTDPQELAEAFAAVTWSYDSTAHTLDQWRAAITGFADPDGPSESAQVARSMLPLWQQWEQLARQNAHATVDNVQASTPAEMQALADDPRTPAGWHGFVIRAEQTVTADGESYSNERQASVAVVCRARCWLWSATYEGPEL